MDEGLESILMMGDYKKLWEKVLKKQEIIQEIHIARGRTVLIDTDFGEFFLTEDGELSDQVQKAYHISTEDFDLLFEHICKDSVYAYEEQLSKGYVPLQGGCRMGVCGELVRQADGTYRMNRISSLNIRIVHDPVLPAEQLLQSVFSNHRFQNIMIISPPGAGKTTLLRNFIRSLSNGVGDMGPYRISVVDERYEISARISGDVGFDLGNRTDVLLGVEKAKGIQMLLRAMAPQIIGVDELGGREDFEALREAAACGVGVIATMHGSSLREVKKRVEFWGYRVEEFFPCIFLLKKEWKTGVCGKQINFSITEERT